MAKAEKTPKTSCWSNIRSTQSSWCWSVFDHEIIESRPGFLLLRVHGKNAKKAFSHEPGGHRFQRVPPTEKRGRVQTSTVTVAILEQAKEQDLYINPKDIEESFTRGSGAGGQHRNKTDTAVILKHIPSGIQIRVDGGRSQYINRQTALDILRTRLKEALDKSASLSLNRNRKEQIGCGMRSDKIRTIAMQRNSVVDHRTNKTMEVKDYYRGNLRRLW